MRAPDRPRGCFFSIQTHHMRKGVAYAEGNGIIHNVFRIPFSAEVAKSVDAVDSKSTIERCAGSIPAFGTIKRMNIEATERWFFCVCNSPNCFLFTRRICAGFFALLLSLRLFKSFM